MEHFIAQYGAAGIFLGAGLEGQTAVILAGLLARQHLISLWLGAISAAAGSAIADQLLFMVGRRWRSNRHVVGISQKPAFARALGLIERFPVVYILVFRFIYGLRLASPVALGVSKTPAWLFGVMNTLGALIWAIVFVTVGYVFGHALAHVFGEEHAGWWTLLVAAGLVAVALIYTALGHRRRNRDRQPDRQAP